MEIRNFSRDDAEKLSGMILSVYDESPIFTTYRSRPTREELSELSRRKATGLRSGYLMDLVATHQGQVVANCELVKRGEEEGLIGIIVAKEHRRNGLGRRLVERCAEGAQALGVRRIYAEINKENRGAILFFSKCGFKDHEDRGKVKVMARELV